MISLRCSDLECDFLLSAICSFNLNMSSSKVDPVLDSSLGEDVVLERLGYAQELKRSIGLLGMIGFSFCIVNSW